MILNIFGFVVNLVLGESFPAYTVIEYLLRLKSCMCKHLCMCKYLCNEVNRLLQLGPLIFPLIQLDLLQYSNATPGQTVTKKLQLPSRGNECCY